MKNVLIVAYEFYPVNTGGSHRPYRMAKFLKENGYSPIIVSVDDKEQDSAMDTSLGILLEDSGFEVIRTPITSSGWRTNLSKSYYFNVVDDTYRRWKGELMLVMLELIKIRQIETLIVTAPPFSMTYLCEHLKKINPKLKLVLDMRDAWVNWNVTPYATWVHYYLTHKAERNAFVNADVVLATSKVTLKDFIEDHEALEASKFLYVPNSFDDYQEQNEVPFPESGKVKIGYVGSFYFDPIREKLLTAPWYKKKIYQWLQYLPYKEEWIYRSPIYFLSILDSLLLKYPSYRNKVEVVFVGTKPSWFDDVLSRFDLAEVVSHQGRLTKQEVILFEKEMDALMITSAKRYSKKDYSIAGKTFEYLSIKKPIIACLTEGAQKDILEPSGLALILNPDTINDSVSKLKQFLDGKVNFAIDHQYCDQLLTKNVLKPLLQILNNE